MKQDEKKKKTYQKPEIIKIKLDAETLLASSCKTAGGPGTGSGKNDKTNPTTCKKLGLGVTKYVGS